MGDTVPEISSSAEAAFAVESSPEGAATVVDISTDSSSVLQQQPLQQFTTLPVGHPPVNQSVPPQDVLRGIGVSSSDLGHVQPTRDLYWSGVAGVPQPFGPPPTQGEATRGRQLGPCVAPATQGPQQTPLSRIYSVLDLSLIHI